MQCGVQLSLEAVRRQLTADINRSAFHRQTALGKKVYDCALDLPMSGFGSSCENCSYLKVS